MGADSLPAMVKRRGLRQVSVELTEADAQKVERIRAYLGHRSWGETVRHILRKHHEQNEREPWSGCENPNAD